MNTFTTQNTDHTFIIHQTEHGKRLHPIGVEEAEELVMKGGAKKLRKGLYQGTSRGAIPASTTRKLEPVHTRGGSRSKKNRQE